VRPWESCTMWPNTAPVYTYVLIALLPVFCVPVASGKASAWPGGAFPPAAVGLLPSFRIKQEARRRLRASATVSPVLRVFSRASYKSRGNLAHTGFQPPTPFLPAPGLAPPLMPAPSRLCWPAPLPSPEPRRGRRRQCTATPPAVPVLQHPCNTRRFQKRHLAVFALRSADVANHRNVFARLCLSLRCRFVVVPYQRVRILARKPIFIGKSGGAEMKMLPPDVTP